MATTNTPRDPASRPSVLLVEDDPLVRELYGSMLRRMRYPVVAAADADGALAVFGTHAVDWVMVDLGLPDMPGLELLARLRAARAGLPAVVVSGRGDRPAGVEDDGVTVFLAKPFQTDDLRAAVDRALGDGHARAADA